jgi:hypothetical protein
MADTAAGGAAPQCLSALQRANEVRFARAKLKRQVRAGSLSAAETVLACPWQARTMPLSELLVSQRGWGRIRCRRLLLSVQVPENKAVGSLTERQRLALAAALNRGRGAPRPQRGGPGEQVRRAMPLPEGTGEASSPD